MSSRAQARPASPAPTTTTSASRGAPEASVGVPAGPGTGAPTGSPGGRRAGEVSGSAGTDVTVAARLWTAPAGVIGPVVAWRDDDGRGGTARPAGTGPHSGDVVARVRLDAWVGRGATGQVWSGTDLDDGSRVAVKLLHDAPDDVDRALGGLPSHPHVLRPTRVQREPPAVVTPLAGGGSLAAQVRARGCLRPAEVVTVVAPLADALAWLHGRGVVHGDVSATNVLFVERGRPVLADLGSARLAGAGQVVATPGYAAPEVVAGGEPTGAADVHGLAAAAWLALTGVVPPSPEDRLPLRLLVPECPDELVDAVTSGLDPDPDRRPTPEELATAARAAVAAEPVGLVPSAALGVRAEEAVTYRVRQAAARERPPRRGRRRRPSARVWWVAAAAVLLVGASVAVAVPALRPDGPPGPVAAPGPPGPPAPAAAPTSAPADVAREVTGGAVAPDVSTRTGLAQVVTDLVARRQAALRAGEEAGLARVHHPDGSTLATDRALVRAGPVDVTYEVTAVDPVETGATGAGLPVAGTGRSRGAVAASVRLTTTTGGAAPTQEEVLVELDRHDGRWLVRRVSS